MNISNMRTAALVITAVLLAGSLGTLSASSAIIASVIALSVVVGPLCWSHPQYAAYFTILLALLPLPTGMSNEIDVVSFSFYIYEPFLYLTAILLLIRSARRVSFNKGFITWCSFLLVLLSISVVKGLPVDRILNDARGLVDMSTAYWIGAIATASYNLGRFGTLVLIVLWFSLASAVITSLGIASLGSVEVSNLYLLGGEVIGNESSRIRMPAEAVALGALAAVVGLFLTRGIRMKAALLWALPSLGILFFSFSRNSILGLAAATMFSLVATLSPQGVFRLIFKGLSLAVMCALAYIAIAITASSLNLEWLSGPMDAYSTRVVEGLSSDVRSKDSSILYREMEHRHGTEAVSRSPVWGHGLGYAYQPPVAGMGIFGSTQAMYYAHNFYLWILIKGGILGFLAFWGLAAPPLLPVRNSSHSTHLALSFATISLLAVSVVAPQPLGAPASVILGACLGSAASLRTMLASSRKKEHTYLPIRPTGSQPETANL